MRDICVSFAVYLLSLYHAGDLVGWGEVYVLICEALKASTASVGTMVIFDVCSFNNEYNFDFNWCSHGYEVVDDMDLIIGTILRLQ